MSANRLTAETGSSPRLRGTEGMEPGVRPAERFIPAPAGNSRACGRRLRRTPVHPRACGEQVVSAVLMVDPDGSSPRLRGTGLADAGGSIVCRFIPAPAGNRVESPTGGAGGSVHPRACGEQTVTNQTTHHPYGSSPRLRGTVVETGILPFHIRFIPAPAGNSSKGPRSSLGASVHPRACGEQRNILWFVAGQLGSSPRLRGTGLTLGVQIGMFRFIPAPAGNRSRRSTRRPTRTVHPRACGEQIDDPTDPGSAVGSSPRLRGTVSKACTMRGYPTVHPRACGEQGSFSSRLKASFGSSPRLRGTACRTILRFPG